MKTSILTTSLAFALAAVCHAQQPAEVDQSTVGTNADASINADAKTDATASPGSSSSTATSPSSTTSGSAGAQTNTQTSSSTAQGDVSAESGVVFRENNPYLIQNGQARRIDNTTVPEGQMLNSQGQTVPLPSDVTGFDDSAAGASTSATASQETTATQDATADRAPTTSAGATTLDPAKTGITMRDGQVFLIRNGKATRLDAANLGGAFMMTLDGRNVPLSDKIDFDASGSASGNPSATANPDSSR